MSEQGYTIDGADAARIVRTLNQIAFMMLEDDSRGRFTDTQMSLLLRGHAIANDRLQAAELMRRTADVIENQMTDDDPEIF